VGVRFGSVGEFIMDVFNTCYEDFYVKSRDKKKRSSRKVA